MNKQEAIIKLQNILNDDIYSWTDNIEKAFKMAIDSLQKISDLQKEDVQLNNLINRQMLNVGVDLLRRVLNDNDTDIVGAARAKYEWGLSFIELYIANIKDLPSVQSERKMGKWIYDSDCYICNQCKSAFGWWADSQTSNYCPNCGADMRGD